VIIIEGAVPHSSPVRKIAGAWQRLYARMREIFLASLGRGGRQGPDDSCACVTAPKKPRLPHLSATAVAELPER